MNVSGSGHISREEMRKSDLINQLYTVAEQNEDEPVVALLASSLGISLV